MVAPSGGSRAAGSFVQGSRPANCVARAQGQVQAELLSTRFGVGCTVR